jgi:hypothetical protein
MTGVVWDGSYLGEFSKDVLQSIELREKDRYCTLNLGDHPLTCRVKSMKTAFPNVIDELKGLFGLPKLGTHHIRVNSRNYLLIRPPEAGITEIPLNEFIRDAAYSSMFRRQVQETFAFRDVLAIPVSYERNLRVRLQPRRNPVPVSYCEPSMTFDASRPILSSALQNRWFNDISVNATLARMIHLDPEDVSAGIAEFRTKIETIISRVDKSLIWSSSFIIERLMTRLTP